MIKANINIHIVIILLSLASLAGCAASVKYELTSLPMAQSSALNLVDNRPADEKDYRLGCGYRAPIDRLGDDNFVPSRMEALRLALENNLDAKLQGKIVKVNRFNVLLYYPRACRISMGAGIAATSYSAGVMFAESGDTTSEAVIAILEIEIDGTRFKSEQRIPVEDVFDNISGAVLVKKQVAEVINRSIKDVSEQILQEK